MEMLAVMLKAAPSDVIDAISPTRAFTEWRQLFGQLRPLPNVSRDLAALHRRGYARWLGKGLWTVTPSGREALLEWSSVPITDAETRLPSVCLRILAGALTAPSGQLDLTVTRILSTFVSELVSEIIMLPHVFRLTAPSNVALLGMPQSEQRKPQTSVNERAPETVILIERAFQNDIAARKASFVDFLQRLGKALVSRKSLTPSMSKAEFFAMVEAMEAESAEGVVTSKAHDSDSTENPEGK